MMSWMSRSTSTPVGGGPFSLEKKRVDPSSAFLLMENHWKQAKAVMDSKSSQSAIDALTVVSHLNQMISFLKLTSKDARCKEFWVRNHCAEEVLQWLAQTKQNEGTLLELGDERKLVQALQGLCELAFEDVEILRSGSGGLGDGSGSGWSGIHALSSLLLEYSLRAEEELGEPARNAFIILIELSSKFAQIGDAFRRETGYELMNMVISGLSATFAQLPTFSEGSQEQVGPFVEQLKFVDNVTHVAPTSMLNSIAECFSNAFLTSVILPAITQDEGDRSLHRGDDQFVTSLYEEIAVVTNYLTMVCENLTHPLLVERLVKFILEHMSTTLLQRMNHKNLSVTVSTLGLINVLLSLYCEDLWYELVLRHLVNQRHLMVNQRTVQLPEINYSDAAHRFLTLIPGCVVETMGPETVTSYYVQYLENEVNRLSVFISKDYPFISSKSTNPLQETTRSPSLFVSWKYKYDGTDQSQEDKSRILQPKYDIPGPSTTEDEGLDSYKPLVADPLTSFEKSEQDEEAAPSKEPFTTISLHQNEEQLHSLGIGSITHSDEPSSPSFTNDAGRYSDGYGSWEGEGSSQVASYGPLLDTLFLHLKHLTKLPPDMILRVTEVLSTLAGSRIPLVTSILLDPNIILQPSFTSFPMLLNIIRVQFEQQLQSNASVLHDVWNAFNKEMMAVQRHLDASSPSNLSASASLSFIHSLSNSFDSSFGENSFTENIKKKISSSSLLNNVFQRKSSGGSISRQNVMTPSPSARNVRSINGSEVAETQLSDSLQTSANFQNYRSKTTADTPGSSSKGNPSNASGDVARTMAIRAIYFSHWLLELSSVAHYLCWKRPDTSVP